MIIDDLVWMLLTNIRMNRGVCDGRCEAVLG